MELVTSKLPRVDVFGRCYIPGFVSDAMCLNEFTRFEEEYLNPIRGRERWDDVADLPSLEAIMQILEEHFITSPAEFAERVLPLSFLKTLKDGQLAYMNQGIGT